MAECAVRTVPVAECADRGRGPQRSPVALSIDRSLTAPCPSASRRGRPGRAAHSGRERRLANVRIPGERAHPRSPLCVAGSLHQHHARRIDRTGSPRAVRTGTTDEG